MKNLFLSFSLLFVIINCNSVNPIQGPGNLASINGIPILITGDSWSGGFPNVRFYENFLSKNIYVVGNAAKGGRGIWGNSYGVMPSLEEEIENELINNSLAEIVVINTGGGNDFALQHYNDFILSNWQNAVLNISKACVDAGKKVIWGNVAIVAGLYTRIRPTPWGIEQTEIVLEYNNWLETFCSANHHGYIDLQAEFIADGRLMPEYDWGDGTHLSEAGSAHLAVLVEEEINRLISISESVCE